MTDIQWTLLFAAVLYATWAAYRHVRWKRGDYPEIRVVPMTDFNDRNNLFEVKVRATSKRLRAHLAQGLAEVEWKWRRFHGLPVIGRILDRIPALERRMELWGHECETQAAVLLYGDDEARYRAGEVRTLADYEGYHFDDWSDAKIEAEMLKLRDKARRWVRENEKRLMSV